MTSLLNGGLTSQTAKLIESVSRMESINSYVLVGGTALSLQLGTRLSEDLDFMSWRKTKNEKREVNWPTIQKELEQVGKIEKIDILGLDHVEFIVEGVKISFYASPNYSPLKNKIKYLNNLILADKVSIGAMKMEVLLRRSKFRDYYDIYSLLQDGCDLKEMIEIALKYSNHKLKSKNLLALLTCSDRFLEEKEFKTMHPKYSVTASDIEKRIREILMDENRKYKE